MCGCHSSIRLASLIDIEMGIKRVSRSLSELLQAISISALLNIKGDKVVMVVTTLSSKISGSFMLKYA